VSEMKLSIKEQAILNFCFSFSPYIIKNCSILLVLPIYITGARYHWALFGINITWLGKGRFGMVLLLKLSLVCNL